MKSIALFTGTRAEYGLMRSLILNLINDDDFSFHLLVSGAHFSDKFGNTIDEIEHDGIKVFYKLPIELNNQYELDMSYQTADTIKVVSKTLIKIDILGLVLAFSLLIVSLYYSSPSLIIISPLIIIFFRRILSAYALKINFV